MAFPSTLDARDPVALLSLARDNLALWARHGPAPSGGMFHCLRDDGSVYDGATRHVVSSTRLVCLFAWAITRRVPPLPPPALPWRHYLDSCLAFLRERHLTPCGGYAWVVRVEADAACATPGPQPPTPPAPADATNRAYALSFVLLAYSAAAAAGVAEARGWLDEVMATLTLRFWEPAHNLYADEASPDFTVVSPYRGQNANMHLTEAHMAAWGATRDVAHLQRARAIARAMCVVQAQRVADSTGCGALVYEHYRQDWSAPDLEYNVDRPKDRFKPWGFQPGHLLEWAKLLAQLEALAAAAPEAAPDAEAGAWRLPTARRFFDAAMRGWDEQRGGGGFVYSLRPEPGLPLGDCDK